MLKTHHLTSFHSLYLNLISDQYENLLYRLYDIHLIFSRITQCNINNVKVYTQAHKCQSISLTFDMKM